MWGGREDREVDRGALHPWWELGTTRLPQFMIHPALTSAPCMPNHLFRQRETRDPVMHADHSVIKFNSFGASSYSALFCTSSCSYINSWTPGSPISKQPSWVLTLFFYTVWSCTDSKSSTFTMACPGCEWMILNLYSFYKGNIPSVQLVFNLHFLENTKECLITLCLTLHMQAVEWPLRGLQIMEHDGF